MNNLCNCPMGHVYVIEVFHIKLNLNNLYQASIYLKTHLSGFLYPLMPRKNENGAIKFHAQICFESLVSFVNNHFQYDSYEMCHFYVLNQDIYEFFLAILTIFLVVIWGWFMKVFMVSNFLILEKFQFKKNVSSKNDILSEHRIIKMRIITLSYEARMNLYRPHHR